MVTIFSSLLMTLASTALASVEPELLAGLRARSIGPAAMSGRIAAIDVHPAHPDTLVVGAATGGVWRSDDGGVTFQAIFDDQPVAAIGAVEISHANPDVIWIGTGEGNPRNSASVGNGVYRSLDGGTTWSHIGLEESERIHRIIEHPTNPRVAWVCAMGAAWGENEQRGVFKTVNAGASWTKVLFVDEKTGCADLVIDPGNPDALLAALWQYRRWPHFFESGGPGSGLYRTVDGGTTWRRASTLDGMPEGDLGRIGLGFSRSNPEIAYALVEAEQNALLRSEDGGVSWKTVNSSPNVSPRPFYFGDIRVDPKLPNRVYRLASSLDLSEDGGKTFRTLAGIGSLHPDHHELWIHPEDPTYLVSGNDGGVGFSRDRGATWRFVRNLPLGQYYHVRVDMDLPYNVYGGLQDNGSWRGPSAVWEQGFGGGIRNFHWTMVAFGDGFDTAPDPEDSMSGYAMSQGGNLSRWNIRKGQGKAIKPDGPDDEPLRFNWNAGFAQDPFDPATIYYGSQFVHRSTDRGESWSIISPDLTTDNEEWQLQSTSGGLTFDVTAAENYTSIISIEPSPTEDDVIWVGTDDGRLWITRDGGENWASLENKARGVPDNTWIPHVTASKHSNGEAFVVFDNHRRSDWTPYVFRVSEYGERWQRIADEDDVWGYALKVEQDPVDENLLFLGTEFGLYVSLDAGKEWFKWTHGVPTVSVMDMAIHPREHDLVLGTHGRSIFILDDISPLRGLGEDTLQKPIHVFDVAAAQQYQAISSPGELMPSNGEYRGENRPYGALITFSLNSEELPHPDTETERARIEEQRLEAPQLESEEADGSGTDKPEEHKATLEISQGDETIRSFDVVVSRGINRAVWDLRRDAFRQPGADEFSQFFGGGGPEVLPGTYQVRVTHGDQEATTEVTVVGDPRLGISRSDMEANRSAVAKTGSLQEAVAEAIARIGSAKADIDVIQRKLKEQMANQTDGEEETDTDDPDPMSQLSEQARDVKAALEELELEFWTPPDTKGIVPRNKAFNRVGEVLRSLQSSWAAPNPTQETYLRQVTALVESLLEEANELFAGPVSELRAAFAASELSLLSTEEPLALQE